MCLCVTDRSVCPAPRPQGDALLDLDAYEPDLTMIELERVSRVIKTAVPNAVRSSSACWICSSDGLGCRQTWAGGHLMAPC